jgi:hypothetical protein
VKRAVKHYDRNQIKSDVFFRSDLMLTLSVELHLPWSRQ